MSTFEEDDTDRDQEEINVDDVETNSSFGSNASDLDLNGNDSCYDESETTIRYFLSVLLVYGD